MAKETKIKASTQDHLDIDTISDDLVILKTGWVAMALTTTAVNFDLLSEAEQDATIYAYGALLNSLSFPIQILIRSKKADITAYFQNLTEAARTQPNPDLKNQIQKYQDFIQTIVQQKTVLDKKFYIIINFSPLELGLKNITRQKSKKGKTKSQLISDAKIALMPKRDHLIKQLARLGLLTKQLTTQELIELFYDIYNPAPTGTQRILLDTASYTTPIVEPAVEIPSPAPQNTFEQSNLQPAPAPIYQPPEPSLIDTKTSPPPHKPQPKADPPPSQTQALQELQEAAANASQLLSGQPLPTPQPIQDQTPPEKDSYETNLRPVPTSLPFQQTPNASSEQPTSFTSQFTKDQDKNL